MKTTRRLLFALTLVLPLAAAQSLCAWETKTIKGWGEITDADGDCKFTEDKGVMLILIPNKWHDLTHTEKYSKLNSPRILQGIEGDFTIEVKALFPLPGELGASGGDNSFRSAGLVIWEDDKSFIRFERAAIAGSTEPFIWLERFKDGKPVVQTSVPTTDAEIGLKVQRKKNAFTFSIDPGAEGKAWREVKVEEAELPGKLKVGVNAINTTLGEMNARLAGFKLEGKRFEEKKADEKKADDKKPEEKKADEKK